jgi:xanthine dehydrogenase accessory factor
MIKHHWQQAVARCQKETSPFSLVTVIGANGSTPREDGSKMVVTSDATYDTIGGGKLEFLATERARDLLRSGKQVQQIHHFPLAAEAEQCCGGSVTVLFEVFPRTAMEIVLFGAGHVGQALIKILSELDAHISWVDNRSEFLPEECPLGVEKIHLENPEDIIEDIPDDAYIVIVTHDHSLDYRLTKEVLDQGNFAYLGLIGSDTKAERFRKRLKHDGFDEQTIDRVTCPIGMPGLEGKLPMQVAVAIAAQILFLTPREEKLMRRGLSWQEIKDVINTEQT